LTPSEIEAAEAAWLRPGGTLPARRQQGLGCVVAFLGMATLTLTPALGNYVDIAPQTAYSVLAAAVVLLFVGAGLGLTGSRRARSAAHVGVDAAARRVVAAHAAGDPSLPQSAVELIVLLRDAGPGAAGRVAPRLGAALEYVQRFDAHFRNRAPGAPPE
jgi:hypothetical protein